MKHSTLTYLFFILTLTGTYNSMQAQEKQKIPLRDSTDGAPDLSYFLASVYGFLPILMPVTEPAVGYGAAGGPVFIHRDREELARGEPSPPGITFAGGMYTQNGSWALAAVHSGVWWNDRIRYLGNIFYGSLNLTYYPTRFNTLVPSYGFNLSTFGFVQQLTFSLGELKLFGGIRYQFSATKVTFNKILENPSLEPLEGKNNLGGLGPVLFTDYRDNIFTPNKGFFIKGTYAYYDSWLGSDRTYHLSSWFAIWYARPLPWLVTGLRGEFQGSWGDIPFFSRPYVNLRGITAMRFQNDHAFTFETEERFDITRRWSLTAFAGLAKAFNMEKPLDEFEWAYNYGGGFRYKIARLFGIYSGIDFGFGPDSWGFYFIFGHAWNRL